MQRFLKRNLLWFFYAGFLILAVLYGAREPFFTTQSAYSAGKYAILAIFFLFLAYSLYASAKESFFKSVVSVNKYLWGLQIGLDLYISVFLSLGLIFLVEGSIVITLIWLVPILVFANLAILPFIILNYGSIIDHFLP